MNAGATYRSFLTGEPGVELLDLVARQLERWVEHKQKGANDQIRLNTPPLQLTIPEGASFWETKRREVQFLRGDIDAGEGLRFTMREGGREATDPEWTTRITGFQPSDTEQVGWVAIDISNDQGKFCETPRIARDLLERLRLHDGVAPVSSAVRWLDDAADLDVLAESLLDPRRRYPIVVASTEDAQDFDREAFLKLLRLWTRGVAGQSQVIALSPELVERFNRALPFPLRTPPVALRTYLPGLDLDNPGEWSRHRVLSTRSLETRPVGQIRGILTNSARTAAHAGIFPDQVDQVADLLVRRMHREALTTRRTRPVPAVDSSPVVDAAADAVKDHSLGGSLAVKLERAVLQSLDADHVTGAVIEQVKARLSGPDADVDLLEKLLIEQDREVERIRRQNAHLVQQLQEMDDLRSDLERSISDAEADALALRRENRYFQTELAKSNPAAAYTPPTAFQDINDFFELMDRIGELTHVQFTGSEDTVLNLSTGDRTGSEARTAWRALVSLDQYAALHLAGEVRTFKEYVEGGGPGDCLISPSKYVPTESDTTIAQFGKHRMFEVPAQVDPKKSVMMLAHIRLGQQDTRAPRMHYYDDVDNTGKIYVGYIGPHLPNTRTARA